MHLDTGSIQYYLSEYLIEDGRQDIVDILGSYVIARGPSGVRGKIGIVSQLTTEGLTVSLVGYPDGGDWTITTPIASFDNCFQRIDPLPIGSTIVIKGIGRMGSVNSYIEGEIGVLIDSKLCRMRSNEVERYKIRRGKYITCVDEGDRLYKCIGRVTRCWLSPRHHSEDVIWANWRNGVGLQSIPLNDAHFIGGSLGEAWSSTFINIRGGKRDE